GSYEPKFGGYIIANNTFRHNGGYGINFAGVGYGSYTKGSTIINNTIYNNTGNIGISLTSNGGNNSNISQNIITEQYTGIYVSSASNTRIFNNTVMNLTGSGISLEYVTSGKVQNNTVFNLSKWGVFLWKSTGSEISGNNITKTAIGVNISDAESSGNYIFNNYFNNTIDAADPYATNYWNTTKTNATNIIGKLFIGGNFWSGYTGADNDGDRIGDTNLPYTVQGRIANGGDYLPLVEKREITNCMDLNTTNETYYLKTDIVYPQSCFNINESNITLDGGAGQLSIIGNNVAGTVGINISQSATVRNMKVTKYETGIIVNASNVTLSNVHVTNSSTGVIVLPNVTNLNFTGNKVEGGAVGINISGSGNIFYNNYFKTGVNVEDTGVNKWNTSCICSPNVVSERVSNGSCALSPTPISNIVGGPCIGGNFWSDYNGT
ncbi:MAG: NosD domain-containing protein, partial [Candidatus Micrarchaeia archaeon]